MAGTDLGPFQNLSSQIDGAAKVQNGIRKACAAVEDCVTNNRCATAPRFAACTRARPLFPLQRRQVALLCMETQLQSCPLVQLRPAAACKRQTGADRVRLAGRQDAASCNAGISFTALANSCRVWELQVLSILGHHVRTLACSCLQGQPAQLLPGLLPDASEACLWLRDRLQRD